MQLAFYSGPEGRRSQGSASVLCFYFSCSKFPELCSVTKPNSVTKPKLGRACVRLGYIPRGKKFRGFEAGRSYKVVAGYFGNSAFRITVYDCPRSIQNAHTSLLLQ